MIEKERKNVLLKNQDKNFNENSTQENNPIINNVDVSKCPNFRKSCRPDYSGGYLYRNVCRAGSFSSCEGKPCGFKCIEYAKRLGLARGYEL